MDHDAPLIFAGSVDFIREHSDIRERSDTDQRSDLDRDVASSAQ
jgi:hypothetical protein